MEHNIIASYLKEAYRKTAADYRKSDDLDLNGFYHSRICATLGGLSSSFGRPINVLDAGCGTGRYFHCLKNTSRLVGLDLCADMLEQARHPVNGDQLSVENIELICGELHSQTFRQGAFDLIYAVGVFGNGCEISTELLSKFHQWLAPDGRLFFDAFDKSELDRNGLLRNQISNYIYRYPILNNIRNVIRKEARGSVPFYYYSQNEIIRMLKSAGFPAADAHSLDCQTPIGPGMKLQCFGFKSSQPAQVLIPKDRNCCSN